VKQYSFSKLQYFMIFRILGKGKLQFLLNFFEWRGLEGTCGVKWKISKSVDFSLWGDGTSKSFGAAVPFETILKNLYFILRGKLCNNSWLYTHYLIFIELYFHFCPLCSGSSYGYIGNTKLKFRRMEKSFSFDWICVVYINFGEKVSVSV